MNKSLKFAIALLLLLQIGFPIGSPLQKAEASGARLKDFNQGDVIRFATYEWILLDPSTGYLLMKNYDSTRSFDNNNNKKFSPNDAANIAYYLNTTWYQSLPEKARNLIQSKNWTIGPHGNESSNQVAARVGLISYSEVLLYSTFLIHPGNRYWTRTPDSSPLDAYVYTVESRDSLIAVGVGSPEQVRPALYLDPEVEINSAGTVIIPGNQNPTATGIPDQTTVRGANTALTLSEYFSDPDGDALSYSATSSDTGVAAVSVTGDELTIVPQGVGEAEITVTADDHFGGNVQSTFQVTVNNQNPTAAGIPDQTTVRGANAALTLSEYFSDPDGDVLSYSATSSDTGVATVSVTGDELTIVPQGVGVSDITVTADDQHGGNVQSAFQVTVNNQNPTAAFTLPDKSMFTNGNAFVISGTKGDPDNDATSVKMRLNDGAVYTLAGPSGDASFSREFQIADQQLTQAESGMNVSLPDGQHKLDFWVEEEYGGTTTETSFTFTLDTAAPVITISGVDDGQVITGRVTPVITVTDAHGYTYQLTLNGDSYTEGTEIRASGSYELKVEAKDEAGNTSSKTVSFTIRNTTANSKSDESSSSPIIGMTVDGAVLTVVMKTERNTENGKVVDEALLDLREADEILARAANSETNTIHVVFGSEQDELADEVVIRLSAPALAKLAQAEPSLTLEVGGAAITLLPASLESLGSGGEEVNYRIAPLRDAEEQAEAANRILGSEMLREHASGRTVSIIGQSIVIETNYNHHPAKIRLSLSGMVLPSDPDELGKFLNELAVYIEHADGEIAVKQGDIVYLSDGRPAGIEVEIDKFSTFTLIQVENPAAPPVEFPAYISGYPDGTFRPSGYITRAELASMLSRNLPGKSDIGTVTPYLDVTAKHWAYEAIMQIIAHGLMVGDGTGHFRPDDLVSRAEMAVVVAKWKELQASPADAFPDTGGHWAQGSIGAAKQAGIIDGYPDGTFRPDQAVTRAEAVKMLNAAFGRPESDQVGQSSWPDVALEHWAIRHIESATRSFTVNPDSGLQQ